MANSIEQEACPVCKSFASWKDKNGGSWRITCGKCGHFEIGWMAAKGIDTFSAIRRANLSGWIRENQGCQILQKDLEFLSQLRTPSVGQKADKLLLYLAHKFPRPGETIELFENVSLELQSISWAVDHKELHYLMREYLHEATGLLLLKRSPTLLTTDEFYKISPEGWARLDTLQHECSQSKIGFIAMWFEESMNDAWLALDKGIRDSGYEPLRIDQKQHNNKIDDEIVARIRRSKFLVADFTGHRGGVYFEAGLAMGLGLPVIWLCRKDELEKTHFDTRQYNFVVWDADKLEQLSKSLQNRIEATIGRGHLNE